MGVMCCKRKQYDEVKKLYVGVDNTEERNVLRIIQSSCCCFFE